MNNDPAQMMDMIQTILYLTPILMVAGFFLIAGVVYAILKWLKFADTSYGEAIAIVLAGSLISFALSAPFYRIGMEIPMIMIGMAFIGGFVLPFFGFAAGTWVISQESIGKCFGLTALIGVAMVILFIISIIAVFAIAMVAGIANS